MQRYTLAQTFDPDIGWSRVKQLSTSKHLFFVNDADGSETER